MEIIKRVLLVASVVCQALLVLAGKGNYILSCYKTGVYINAKFAINSHCSYKKNLAIKSLCILLGGMYVS